MFGKLRWCAMCILGVLTHEQDILRCGTDIFSGLKSSPKQIDELAKSFQFGLLLWIIPIAKYNRFCAAERQIGGSGFASHRAGKLQNIGKRLFVRLVRKN